MFFPPGEASPEEVGIHPGVHQEDVTRFFVGVCIFLYAFSFQQLGVLSATLQASDKVVPVLGEIVVPWGSVFRKSRAFSKNA